MTAAPHNPLVRPDVPERTAAVGPAPSCGPAVEEHGRTVRRRFPGVPSQIACARGFVARHLADCPDPTTAALLTSELATNAIRHTASGLPAGTFEVGVHRVPGRVRVEVHDLGNLDQSPHPRYRAPYDTAEHGRGLDLVEALATAWGSEPRGDGPGRRVWFELVWDGTGEADRAG